MISASQLKFLTALQVKKYRQKYSKFTLEGTKLVSELLQQDQIQVAAIYGLERWAEENASLIRPFYQKFNLVTEQELRKVSGLSTANQVLAVADTPDRPFEVHKSGFSMFLDGIRDPGNMGTLIRIADWFGMSAVYCSPDCVDYFSPKVVQSSMGAVLRVPLYQCSLMAIQEQASALPVIGAVMEGENVFDSKLPEDAILVIGNESTGIRPDIMPLLSQKVTIPRANQSQAESLNAAVAAGILAAMLTNRK